MVEALLHALSVEHKNTHTSGQREMNVQLLLHRRHK